MKLSVFLFLSLPMGMSTSQLIWLPTGYAGFFSRSDELSCL